MCYDNVQVMVTRPNWIHIFQKNHVVLTKYNVPVNLFPTSNLQLVSAARWCADTKKSVEQTGMLQVGHLHDT